MAWWAQAQDILARCLHSTDDSQFGWYRFARGWLGIDSQDAALSRRFQDVYAEGFAGAAEPSARAQVKCRVRNHGERPLAAVAFEDPEPLDSFAFCHSLFPDRGYVEGPAGAGGWRTIALRDSPDQPLIALHENAALVDRRQVWQSFVANYAINRVLRLQREVLFFHAASVAIDGHGIMLVGPKGSGKTTTSVTLASRGHGFLGDEMAAVERDTKVLLPLRRAVSLRSGPRSRRVDEQLAHCPHSVEKYADGADRTLVNIGGLFPQAGAAPATLSIVLFLQGLSDRPRVEPFSFGLDHFPMLSPLACSMWGVSAGARIMDVTRLLRGIKCCFLKAGPPEETADMIEKIATGRSLH